MYAFCIFFQKDRFQIQTKKDYNTVKKGVILTFLVRVLFSFLNLLIKGGGKLDLIVHYKALRHERGGTLDVGDLL